MLGKSEDDFPFARGEVILAKCDKEVYYAKILSLNHVKKTALLLFDDDSKEEVGFNNIYSGKLLVLMALFGVLRLGSQFLSSFNK